MPPVAVIKLSAQPIPISSSLGNRPASPQSPVAHRLAFTRRRRRRRRRWCWPILSVDSIRSPLARPIAPVALALGHWGTEHWALAPPVLRVLGSCRPSSFTSFTARSDSDGAAPVLFCAVVVVFSPFSLSFARWNSSLPGRLFTWPLLCTTSSVKVPCLAMQPPAEASIAAAPWLVLVPVPARSPAHVCPVLS